MSVPDHQIDPPEDGDSFTLPMPDWFNLGPGRHIDPPDQIDPPDSYVTEDEMSDIMDMRRNHPYPEGIRSDISRYLTEENTPHPITVGIDPGNNESTFCVETHIGITPDQIDPSEIRYSVYDVGQSSVNIDEESRIVTFCGDVDHPLNVGDRITMNGMEGVIISFDVGESEIRYSLRYGPPLVFPRSCEQYNMILVDQIMEIFHATALGHEWLDEMETCSWGVMMMNELLETRPGLKLGKLNQLLQLKGVEPTIDHEQSVLTPGKSKGTVAYIHYNQHFKKLIEELCP